MTEIVRGAVISSGAFLKYEIPHGSSVGMDYFSSSVDEWTGSYRQTVITGFLRKGNRTFHFTPKNP